MYRKMSNWSLILLALSSIYLLLNVISNNPYTMVVLFVMVSSFLSAVLFAIIDTNKSKIIKTKIEKDRYHLIMYVNNREVLNIYTTDPNTIVELNTRDEDIVKTEVYKNNKKVKHDIEMVSDKIIVNAIDDQLQRNSKYLK